MLFYRQLHRRLEPLSLFQLLKLLRSPEDLRSSGFFLEGGSLI